MLLTDGSDGGMCALLRSRRRLCEFRHGSLCTCLRTLATRASGGRALLSTESCYPCSFALFFILAPSGPCERQLRCTERPLLASQPHTPAPDRAPSSQQARPPRLPPSSPNERTCEHKTEHAGPPTAKSLSEWCEQEPWPPPSCRHPLSPHPRPLAVTSHLTSSPPPTIQCPVVQYNVPSQHSI